MPNYKMTK